jgi:hypothetical protein
MTTRKFSDEELQRGETTPPLASADPRRLQRAEPASALDLIAQWEATATKLEELAAGVRLYANKSDRHDASVRAAAVRGCAAQLRSVLARMGVPGAVL